MKYCKPENWTEMAMWESKVKILKVKPIMYLVNTHLLFSYLHKNSKICQMIAGADDFNASFFDQRTSFTRPGTVESASAQIMVSIRSIYLSLWEKALKMAFSRMQYFLTFRFSQFSDLSGRVFTESKNVIIGLWPGMC